MKEPQLVELNSETLKMKVGDFGTEYIIFEGRDYYGRVCAHVVFSDETLMDLIYRNRDYRTVRLPFSHEEWQNKTLKQLVDFASQLSSSPHTFYKEGELS